VHPFLLKQIIDFKKYKRLIHYAVYHFSDIALKDNLELEDEENKVM
jgi:hypothetical protein